MKATDKNENGAAASESASLENRQLFYDHSSATLCSLDRGPLAGLRHRTVIEHTTGSKQLALWQEEHLPGFAVPLHLHDCEEIITVVMGAIEGQIRDEKFVIKAQQSFLIPEGEPHGFRVIGDGPMRLLALFSSSNPKIFRLDETESHPPWKGGTSNHLDT